MERELVEAREELQRYRDREQHVAQALLHAEAIAADLRKNAERERQEVLDEARTMADALLDEAETRADEIVGQTRGERDRLEQEITQLTERRRELKGQYRELLVSALELVDDEDADDQGEGHAEPPKAPDEARV